MMMMMMMCASSFLFSDFAFEEDAFFNLVTFALPLFFCNPHLKRDLYLRQ